MDIRLDVHTHSIMSGHAYSTIQEMAKEAADKGLNILGITEHAPSLPGACHEIYFRNMHVVPRKMYGVSLMLGAELNILDITGAVDLNDEVYPMLDLRIAGIHKLCWKGGTTDENTGAMIRAISNPWVQIISHPGDGTASLHFEPIVLAAKESGTLLEINNSSLNPVRNKVDAHDNNIMLLRLCKKYDVPVILGSDAHVSFAVGGYDNIYPLLSETEFPERLIVNSDTERFLSCLKSDPR